MPMVSPSEAPAVTPESSPRSWICADCQRETWIPIGPLDGAGVQCRCCFRRTRSVFCAPAPAVQITRLPEPTRRR